MNGQAQDTPSTQMFQSLQEMRLGIEQLLETDNARRDEMQFLADLREKIAQGLTIVHEQLLEVRKDIGGVQKEVKILRIPPAQKSTQRVKDWRQKALLVSGGCIAGLLLMGGVWMCWPTPTRPPISATKHEAFTGDLNGVLRKVYGQLPKSVQEQIRDVYRQHHFVEPGPR